MDTKWNQIRRSGLYKLLLFLSTVLLIALFLSNFRTYIVYYYEYGERNSHYLASDSGVTKDVLSAVQRISDDYIHEQINPKSYDFFFVITGKRGTFTNAANPETLFEEAEYAVKIAGEEIFLSQGLKFMELRISPEDTPDLTVAFSEQWILRNDSKWTQVIDLMREAKIGMVAYFLLLLLSITEQVIVVGKGPTAKLRANAADRIPTEIGVALFFLTLVLTFRFSRNWFSLIINRWDDGTAVFELIVAGLSFLWLLSLFFVRKLKSRTFVRYSILGGFFHALVRIARGKDSEIPEARRVYGVVLASLFAGFVTFYFYMIHVIDFMTFVALVAAIIGIMFYLMHSILERIDESVHRTVQEQIASERMKVDLVTNVSHDLNTPLTSIIGYVDLLQDEEMSDAAKDYVNVLQKKSLRLKGIVSDLFELSKSTSGAMEINREILNYSVLINQTLADLQDSIVKSERQIVTKLPDEPVYVYADGRQLYRVLQNLIDNALNYSMPNTRIFLTVQTEERICHLKMKNVSAYPLDFDEEEILSRFVRGDLSRTEEGSGLGLAIAKSFTENNDGTFQVFVQEDVFIAYQTLPTVREEII